jgi:DNA-binding response OmpR family regulator
MTKVRGLIIDDDRDLSKFLRVVLSLAGFECETVHTPRAALNFLASNEPDLIFMDLNLNSDIQGSDLLYHIRSNPRFDASRVIVITGHPSLAQPLTSLADLVLIKPVEIDQLSQLASRLLMMEVKPYEFRDPESGLYNLKFFRTRLALACDRSKRRPDFIFGTLAIELQAPEKGEQPSEVEWQQATQEVAVRWQAKFRPTDIFGRLGRRKVIGLFEDLKEPQDVQVIIDRLTEDLSLPLELESRSLSLGACIGGLVEQGGCNNAQEILDGLEQALDKARLNRWQRCHVVYPTVKEPGD